jgi:hypothetical protein
MEMGCDLVGTVRENRVQNHPVLSSHEHDASPMKSGLGKTFETRVTAHKAISH